MSERDQKQMIVWSFHSTASRQHTSKARIFLGYCVLDFSFFYRCLSISTNAPVVEAVEIVLARAEEDSKLDERAPHSLDWIAELSQPCLWSTYFRYAWGISYKALHGLAIISGNIVLAK